MRNKAKHFALISTGSIGPPLDISNLHRSRAVCLFPVRICAPPSAFSALERGIGDGDWRRYVHPTARVPPTRPKGAP